MVRFVRTNGGRRFTLADALLGIETYISASVYVGDRGFTLADALLGIETVWMRRESSSILVSLWLMPF